MDKRILDKIKKCLELAKKATNEYEAAAAMRSAQALMEKHRISSEQVGFAHIEEKSVHLNISRVVSYQAKFVNLIERAFGVKAILADHFLQGREIRFIGTAPQPELATYCWAVLWPKLKEERTSYVKKQPNQCKRATKVARGDVFACGWVNGVYQQVHDFALSEHEIGIVESYTAHHYPNLRNTKPMHRGKKANKGSAESDGYTAGKKHSIHRPINGAEQQKLSMQ